jgi:hypothetical protein
MPNAWFYFVIPLAAAVVFLTAGVVILRRFRRGGRDKSGNVYGRGSAVGGIVLVLIGGGVSLGLVLTSPTPWQRQRLFDHVLHTSPQRIQKFVVKAGTDKREHAPYKPLTRTDVVIDDPARIARIATLLGSAREISPNHPRTQWSTRVEMVTNDGTFYFRVTATEPSDVNGTLVNISPNPQGGGWNLGDFRADGLEIILEDAARQAGEG